MYWYLDWNSYIKRVWFKKNDLGLVLSLAVINLSLLNSILVVADEIDRIKLLIYLEPCPFMDAR